MAEVFEGNGKFSAHGWEIRRGYENQINTGVQTRDLGVVKYVFFKVAISFSNLGRYPIIPVISVNFFEAHSNP